MSFAVTVLRRSIWLLLIGAVGGVAWSWWSDRTAPPSPTTPPEWPPLDAQAADAPDAPLLTDASGWVTAIDDGSCPISHPVKANGNSGIFHVPGGRFYDRTKPERCYTTPDSAIADGYRQAKN
jgi:hypothetical protein